MTLSRKKVEPKTRAKKMLDCPGRATRRPKSGRRGEEELEEVSVRLAKLVDLVLSGQEGLD